MEYLHILSALIAGIHAFTYAKWLRENGNKTGAAGVYAIIFVGIALPVYRLFKAE